MNLLKILNQLLNKYITPIQVIDYIESKEQEFILANPPFEKKKS